MKDFVEKLVFFGFGLMLTGIGALLLAGAYYVVRITP